GKLAEYVDADTMYALSDIITYHVPCLPTTKHMVNDETLAKMKDGVVFVNTSRGNNVDEAALLAALNSGKVRGAGLDVYAEEPSANAELYSHPNVSCTPHIGAATMEAQKRIGAEIVEIIRNF
ncbi:MAG: 3-phosphoglycerate dehydrogenase, partial [Oscillospiraceae bacterium]|nr:3-phosphoglycerate dehydrogenase [Oscillospiraceae bacterium]